MPLHREQSKVTMGGNGGSGNPYPRPDPGDKGPTWVPCSPLHNADINHSLHILGVRTLSSDTPCVELQDLRGKVLRTLLMNVHFFERDSKHTLLKNGNRCTSGALYIFELGVITSITRRVGKTINNTTHHERITIYTKSINKLFIQLYCIYRPRLTFFIITLLQRIM